jgi:hypothetical protein
VVLCLVEKHPRHIGVAGHSDAFVTLQRLLEQPSCPFAITRGGAINQHHRMETGRSIRRPMGKASGLRMLAEHDEALGHQRQHQPRTSGIRLPASMPENARLIEDCQCAIAIACLAHLSKNRSNAESLNSAAPGGAQLGHATGR